MLNLWEPKITVILVFFTSVYKLLSPSVNCYCESVVVGSQGQDDLRQDAVMQQVFHMCSTLLQRNTETRKRKLNIRRYKVQTLLIHTVSVLRNITVV